MQEGAPALAAAVRTVLDDPRRYRAAYDAAGDVLATLTWEEQAGVLAALYEQVFHTSRSRTPAVEFHARPWRQRSRPTGSGQGRCGMLDRPCRRWGGISCRRERSGVHRLLYLAFYSALAASGVYRSRAMANHLRGGGLRTSRS